MKLTRSILKDIIKECLTELAEEGKLPISRPLNEGQPGIGSAPAANGQPEMKPSLRTAVNLATKFVSGGDQKKSVLYESIFEDTARTTLQKQLAATTSGAGILVESAVSPEERQFDQVQLGQFEAKDRWALLAFAGKPKS